MSRRSTVRSSVGSTRGPSCGVAFQYAAADRWQPPRSLGGRRPDRDLAPDAGPLGVLRPGCATLGRPAALGSVLQRGARTSVGQERGRVGVGGGPVRIPPGRLRQLPQPALENRALLSARGLKGVL